MSIMKTGITPDTYERLLLDQGLVYVDYGESTQRLVGATSGGNKIDISREIRQMKFDGAPGDVKGDKRVVGVTAKLTVNISEFSTENILMANPGASKTTGSTHDAIAVARNIQEGDYFKNVALVLAKAGTDELFVYKLSNALALNGFSLDAKEKAEGVATIEFTGHYAPNAFTVEPWSISNPLEDGTGYYTLSYKAGAGGEILGKSTQIIASGEDGEKVFAAAGDGYTFSAWSDSSTDNPRKDTNVLADAVITATFTS